MKTRDSFMNVPGKGSHHAGAADQLLAEELKRQNELKLAPYVVAARREALLKRIYDNPLYKQYEQHISTARAHNSEPWHAVGERLHAAALCAMAATNHQIAVYGLKGEAASWREQVMLQAAEDILRATPYLWADEIEKVADAAPLPKHVVSEKLLASPAMFWSRETCYTTNNGLTESNWIYIGQEPNGVTIVNDSMTVDERNGPVTGYGVCLAFVRFGATYPTDFAEDPIALGNVDRLLKRCAFLASPYISRDTSRMARHHRRQLERAGEPREAQDEPIHVVKLRNIQKQPAQSTGETRDVEWKHKWWVKSHYRAQWYPSEQAHRVIWIAPFLKGPPNAPLLEKIYAVVR